VRRRLTLLVLPLAIAGGLASGCGATKDAATDLDAARRAVNQAEWCTRHVDRPHCMEGVGR
jgi:hypothetical protein